MKEIKKSAIRVATEEIIEKIGLTTPNEQGEKVPIAFDDNVSDQEVEQVFKDAVGYIDPVLDKNKFSLATKTIIHNSNPELFPEVDATVKEVKKEVTPEVETPADDLFTQINRCERLKDLKEIAQANAEFKGLRGRLNSYKSLDDLHDAMIDVLNSGEPAYVVAERLHEQNIEKQPINAGKKFEARMEVVPAGDKKEATLVPDKKEKKATVKPPVVTKVAYSRVDSICDALKTGKCKTKEDLAIVANQVYVKQGGTDNIKESKNIMKYVLPALAAFEIEVPS